VLHAKTEFTVRLALDAGLLRIEVSDLSPRRPQPRDTPRTRPLVGACRC
jgi:hypothetical protein